MDARSNADWLAALRGEGEDHARAIRDLGARLAGISRRILATRGGELDVDDLVQETLVRILDRLDSFRGDSAFTTWATGVAIRVVHTELRRRAARASGLDVFEEARLDVDLSKHATHDPLGTTCRSEILAELRRAIDDRLTERQRIAILAELRGIPTVEIAERLDTNQNALYKLVHDARKKLRSALLEAGYTAEAIRDQVLEGTR